MQQNFFFLLIILLFISCNNQQPSGVAEDSVKRITVEMQNSPHVFSIQSFTDFPEEILGCSCYFSFDSTEFKNKKYIYAANYDSIAFVNIDGNMQRFTLINREEKENNDIEAAYKNDHYTLSVFIKDEKQNGYETRLKTGEIRITDTQGNIVRQRFYGECGC